MKQLFIIIFSIGLGSAVPAFGGAMTGGASEITQILNNVQLTLSYLEQVSQTAQQLEQLKTQIEIHKIHIENARRMTKGDAAIIEQYARELWEHWQKQNQTAWGASEIDKLYRQKYPTYKEILDGALDGSELSDLYAKWSEEAHEALKSTLEGNSFTRDLIDGKEARLLKVLEDQSNSAPGMMKVLQVANDVARAQIAQIQALRQLMAKQNDATQHVAALEQVEKAAAAKQTANLFRPVKVPENKKYRRPVINWRPNK